MHAFWHKLARIAGLATATALAGGCADEEPPLSCPAVVNPGGDPIGTWEAIDYCHNRNVAPIFPLTGPGSDPMMQVSQCPDAYFLIEGVAARGTLVLGADRQFRDNLVITYSQRIRADLRCFGPPPQITSCELLGEFLRVEGKPDPGAAPGDKTLYTQRVFCKESGGSCECAFVMIINNNGSFGGFSLPMPGQVRTDNAGDYTFRVEGRELRLQTREAHVRLLRQ